MNTRFLETLVWLTRLQSFSRVADKLHTSQPAISNRINKLEELLGVRLYDRNARLFELTPAGRRILRHAEEMTKLAAEIYELAASDEQNDSLLRIGVLELTTVTWLAPFLKCVMEAFPKAEFKVGTGSGPELLQQLRDDELDLVFVINPINEPGIVTRPLYHFAMSWVANPRNFPCDIEMNVADLSRLPVIMPTKGGSIHDAVIDYFNRFEVHAIGNADRRLVIEAISSQASSVALVSAGLGIIPLPTFTVADEFAAGRLAEIRVQDPLPVQTMAACFKQPVTSQLIGRLVEMAGASVAEHVADHSPEHIWT